MELTIRTADHVTVVEIAGDIDGKTAHDIQEQLLSQIEPGSKLLLNMSQVDYMSSAGLRMLLSMYRQVKGNQAKMALVGLSEEIQDVMAVTGFLSHFTVCETVDAGLQALQEDE
ncbi:anti-sigma factor antagonist [candidate division KSB3 bacterium]|uniref:Anti-sigma factor antagonist n=1 Tax=candidate division KSB3 bacterium TaxID=2044937 RepID=A0A9D5K011_9BACT|nr:anti-sigma factor antagonist [candidate division KSB3 bacterium]MBD3327096.1 anti-sigma factor antagonist [candidate division KSB3 bacterium]